MKIAFVGLKKDYKTIDERYVNYFNRYHLEIPWYYAAYGGNKVTVTTTNYDSEGLEVFASGGSFRNITEEDYKKSSEKYDVVVHWRKWQEDLKGDGLNLLHTCDHSYPSPWIETVQKAFQEKKLYGILCYRSWHRRNMEAETKLPSERFFTDCTLGVDCDIYKPAHKDPHQMLWSSDPGRGLNDAIAFALRMHVIDKRFRLHICYPDYVSPPYHIPHPALVWHGNVQNGEKLWNLFNTSGILPYTSTFQEPSSRAHRQAQAAGCMVLYPPNMGSPSELIQDGLTGFVAPVNTWPAIVLNNVNSGQWKNVGARAREFAQSQDWFVQSENFNKLVKGIIG